MIEAKELRIGDIVSLRGAEDVRVAEIELFTCTIIDSKGDVFPNVEYKDLIATPIAPEVLKRNGWKRWKENGIERYPLSTKHRVLHVRRVCLDYYALSYGRIGQHLPLTVRYIHELQHCLLVLGLNADIKI